MNKKVLLYYVLSFTWGLPMTLIGCIGMLVLICIGYKPKKFKHMYYIETKGSWGGVTLGCFIFTCKNPSQSLLEHESGHTLQNIMFGPLMPFLVAIPSCIRYWFRQFTKPTTIYDGIWFERQATNLGYRMDNIFKKGKNI